MRGLHWRRSALRVAAGDFSVIITMTSWFRAATGIQVLISAAACAQQLFFPANKNSQPTVSAAAGENSNHQMALSVFAFSKFLISSCLRKFVLKHMPLIKSEDVCKLRLQGRFQTLIWNTNQQISIIEIYCIKVWGFICKLPSADTLVRL